MTQETATLTQAWMQTREVKRLFSVLDGEARFIGGCVRNALLKEPVGDIDIATPLKPEVVVKN